MRTIPSSWAKAPESNALSMSNAGSPPAKFKYGFCQVSEIKEMHVTCLSFSVVSIECPMRFAFALNFPLLHNLKYNKDR